MAEIGKFNQRSDLTPLAIIGSDIQEVIGTAIAFKILFGFPIWVGSIITILDTFTFLFIHACGVRKLEALFAVLVGTMAICFWCNMFIVLVSQNTSYGGNTHFNSIYGNFL